jgi:hypothetical protein
MRPVKIPVCEREDVESAIRAFECKMRVVRGKQIVEAYKLDGKAQMALNFIIAVCEDTEDMRILQSFIKTGSRKVSGRSFDLLLSNMLSLKMTHEVSYLLDRPVKEILTEKLAQSILLREEGRGLGRFKFNVEVSYREFLRCFSKRNFDTFARGDFVNVTLKDGSTHRISIGQSMFFIWVLKFDILNFTNTILDSSSRSNRTIKANLVQTISAHPQSSHIHYATLTHYDFIMPEDVDCDVTFLPRRPNLLTIYEPIPLTHWPEFRTS